MRRSFHHVPTNWEYTSCMNNSVSMGSRMVIGNVYVSREIVQKNPHLSKEAAFIQGKKLSDVSSALETVGLQDQQLIIIFWPKWLTALQGSMVYFSSEKFVDEDKYLWQQTWSLQSNRQQLFWSWPGACSPSCRVKSLPESHPWMFWAASQCLRQGVAFLTHFLHWGWVKVC